MPSLRDSSAALLHIMAFLGGSVLWMLVVGMGLVVWVAIAGAGISTDDPMEWMNGLEMGITTMVQIAGLAAWAVLLCATLGPPGHWLATDLQGLGGRLRSHLGMRGAPAALWGAAALGGLCVWTLPSYLAGWLMEHYGLDSFSLQATSRFLLEGPLHHRVAMAIAVTVSAPLFEEVIFRGYLWTVTARAGGQRFAWFMTTVLFALYHIDPVHVVTLLPTAAFLGWLRYRSGSLWPSVVGHFANNGIALVVLTALGSDSESELPFALALAGTGFTVVVCAVAAYATRPLPPGESL